MLYLLLVDSLSLILISRKTMQSDIIRKKEALKYIVEFTAETETACAQTMIISTTIRVVLRDDIVHPKLVKEKQAFLRYNRCYISTERNIRLQRFQKCQYMNLFYLSHHTVKKR